MNLSLQPDLEANSFHVDPPSMERSLGDHRPHLFHTVGGLGQHVAERPADKNPVDRVCVHAVEFVFDLIG